MRLQDRVQIAASELLSSVLARAGSRLRTKAQGDESLRAKVKGLTNAELVALAAASDLAPAEVLISEADFGPLGTRFRSWAKSARREALAVVGTEALSHGVTATEFKTFKAEEFATAAEDDKAGWVMLSAALVDLGRARIFDPSPVQEEGEFDETLAVPPVRSVPRWRVPGVRSARPVPRLRSSSRRARRWAQPPGESRRGPR